MSSQENKQTHFGNIVISDLICPVCKAKDLKVNPDGLICSNNACECSQKVSGLVNGKPVLIDFQNSLMYECQYTPDSAESVIPRIKGGLKTRFRDVLRGKSQVTSGNIEALIEFVSKNKSPRILIIGGAEIGVGIDKLYEKFGEKILVLDIYDSGNVDILADAHSIPFRDGIFDVVIIQAVLEHVLNPQMVIAEVSRILRTEGIVYAETPFMQQVHEGAYDFTRFTESGHRYLFKNFIEIKSGFTTGAGTSLLWSLDFFFSGLLRTRLAGKLVQVFFFWLRYCDQFIPKSFNIDAACGVFFMGKKGSAEIESKSILLHYQGHQLRYDNTR